MNAEAEAFLEAVRALDLLQDQLDWADVKPSWKSAAARWAKQLRKCRYPADLDLLWKLAGELMKDIKPTNFIVGWLVNADGSESTRYRQWLTETDVLGGLADVDRFICCSNVCHQLLGHCDRAWDRMCCR
jgi:hypothetical protein